MRFSPPARDGFVALVAWMGSFSALAVHGQTAPQLEPLFFEQDKDGQERIVARAPSATSTSAPAFRAVVSSDWPAGLVPVFAVVDGASFQLRRLPSAGQETSTEPLFFALPPQDEPHAASIAGRWSCVSTNARGGRNYPQWELAVDGERLAGRFAPDGEYRVAFITGGTFRSNRFELNAEYGHDRYVLAGRWRNGNLAGTWRQTDQDEHGVWEATRPEPPPPFPQGTNLVALYEWRRGNERRYSTETNLSAGWQRAARPLCRVWRRAEPRKNAENSKR